MPSSADRGSEDARVARTRADVSRAALDVLRSEGWDDVTHAKVAEVAGYSKTTLYAHWPSRLDLVTLALDALGELPHHATTGDLRSDLIGELTVFRRAIEELKLDHILSGLAQWASVDEIAVLRDRINAEGQRPMRELLAQRFSGARLEAALSMLTGVVACPSLMFGALPEDTVVEAAVDIVLSTRS
ncbi:transcriptional regulator [Mycolicibacterium chubuense NBB4]|uniref:Transcriptional regulator n=1 Tax=Mycolicibacterium chubuense (strain NBB4) TaxID=710421 RepID=I4BCH2_MYCCN|nr:TetR/AcrR family transcriptional regulator [Mycolicibacterium chubuense]AFM14979.1 transcriptional regulator [Mycolicibacterium chubuense NBB4]